MRIIDAHLHFSKIKRFENCAKTISKVDYSIDGLVREFRENEVLIGVGMGLEEMSDKAFPDKRQLNPMGLDLMEELPSCLKYCIGINPIKLEENLIGELHEVEKRLQTDNVVGIKLYPGYYPVAVNHTIYDTIYSLAELYKVPIVVHCGKTYSIKGHLNTSHPLLVNDVAMKHSNVNFIIAHLGDPWVMDTAAMISNNNNVYSDLSGLIIGDAHLIAERGKNKFFKEHIQMALEYANSYDKILFGTDWPLVEYKPYINWIKGLIPEEHHSNVFFNNAIKVYDKILNTNTNTINN